MTHILRSSVVFVPRPRPSLLTATKSIVLCCVFVYLQNRADVSAAQKMLKQTTTRLRKELDARVKTFKEENKSMGPKEVKDAVRVRASDPHHHHHRQHHHCLCYALFLF